MCPTCHLSNPVTVGKRAYMLYGHPSSTAMYSFQLSSLNSASMSILAADATAANPSAVSVFFNVTAAANLQKGDEITFTLPYLRMQLINGTALSQSAPMQLSNASSGVASSFSAVWEPVSPAAVVLASASFTLNTVVSELTSGKRSHLSRGATGCLLFSPPILSLNDDTQLVLSDVKQTGGDRLASVDLTNGFTLATWMHLSGSALSAHGSLLDCRAQSGVANPRFRIYFNSASMCFRYQSSAPEPAISMLLCWTQFPAIDSVWKHVVVTVPASGMINRLRLFIDGELIRSDPLAYSGPYLSSSNLPLQRSYCLIDNVNSGAPALQIASYHLFPRALASAEVRVLAAAPPASILLNRVVGVSPESAARVTGTVVTLTGANFGCSAADLTGVFVGPLARQGVATPAITGFGHSTPCAAFAWLNSTAVTCTLPGTAVHPAMLRSAAWFFTVTVLNSPGLIHPAAFFAPPAFAAGLASATQSVLASPASSPGTSLLLNSSFLLRPMQMKPENGAILSGVDLACLAVRSVPVVTLSASSYLSLDSSADTGGALWPSVMDVSLTGLTVAVWSLQSTALGGSLLTCGSGLAAAQLNFVQFGFDNAAMPDSSLWVSFAQDATDTAGTATCTSTFRVRRRVNIWQHYALSIGVDGIVAVYVDGRLEGSWVCAQPILSAIARPFCYVNRATDGTSVEMSVASYDMWPRSLSSAEIELLMRSPPASLATLKVLSVSPNQGPAQLATTPLALTLKVSAAGCASSITSVLLLSADGAYVQASSGAVSVVDASTIVATFNETLAEGMAFYFQLVTGGVPSLTSLAPEAEYYSLPTAEGARFLRAIAQPSGQLKLKLTANSWSHHLPISFVASSAATTLDSALSSSLNKVTIGWPIIARGSGAAEIGSFQTLLLTGLPATVSGFATSFSLYLDPASALTSFFFQTWRCTSTNSMPFFTRPLCSNYQLVQQMAFTPKRLGVVEVQVPAALSFAWPIAAGDVIGFTYAATTSPFKYDSDARLLDSSMVHRFVFSAAATTLGMNLNEWTTTISGNPIAVERRLYSIAMTVQTAPPYAWNVLNSIPLPISAAGATLFTTGGPTIANYLPVPAPDAQCHIMVGRAFTQSGFFVAARMFVNALTPIALQTWKCIRPACDNGYVLLRSYTYTPTTLGEQIAPIPGSLSADWPVQTGEFPGWCFSSASASTPPVSSMAGSGVDSTVTVALTHPLASMWTTPGTTTSFTAATNQLFPLQFTIMTDPMPSANALSASNGAQLSFPSAMMPPLLSSPLTPPVSLANGMSTVGMNLRTPAGPTAETGMRCFALKDFAFTTAGWMNAVGIYARSTDPMYFVTWRCVDAPSPSCQNMRMVQRYLYTPTTPNDPVTFTLPAQVAASWPVAVGDLPGGCMFATAPVDYGAGESPRDDQWYATLSSLPAVGEPYWFGTSQTRQYPLQWRMQTQHPLSPSSIPLVASHTWDENLGASTDAHGNYQSVCVVRYGRPFAQSGWVTSLNVRMKQTLGTVYFSTYRCSNAACVSSPSSGPFFATYRYAWQPVVGTSLIQLPPEVASEWWVEAGDFAGFCYTSTHSGAQAPFVMRYSPVVADGANLWVNALDSHAVGLTTPAAPSTANNYAYPIVYQIMPASYGVPSRTPMPHAFTVSVHASYASTQAELVPLRKGLVTLTLPTPGSLVAGQLSDAIVLSVSLPPLQQLVVTLTSTPAGAVLLPSSTVTFTPTSGLQQSIFLSAPTSATTYTFSVALSGADGPSYSTITLFSSGGVISSASALAVNVANAGVLQFAALPAAISVNQHPLTVTLAPLTAPAVDLAVYVFANGGDVQPSVMTFPAGSTSAIRFVLTGPATAVGNMELQCKVLGASATAWNCAPASIPVNGLTAALFDASASSLYSQALYSMVFPYPGSMSYASGALWRANDQSGAAVTGAGVISFAGTGSPIYTEKFGLNLASYTTIGNTVPDFGLTPVGSSITMTMWVKVWEPAGGIVGEMRLLSCTDGGSTVYVRKRSKQANLCGFVGFCSHVCFSVLFVCPC